jgi:hypothetical protein
LWSQSVTTPIRNVTGSNDTWISARPTISHAMEIARMRRT